MICKYKCLVCSHTWIDFIVRDRKPDEDILEWMTVVQEAIADAHSINSFGRCKSEKVERCRPKMNAIVVLEVMWDWEARTSSFGYAEQAPEYFRINPNNHTGSRLYDWLPGWNGLVTNACPELVSSATGRGKPSTTWLAKNLFDLYAQTQFELLLVCGKVAQDTYTKIRGMEAYRVVYCPHPAARGWTREGLATTKRMIQSRTDNLCIKLPKPPSRRVRVFTL